MNDGFIPFKGLGWAVAGLLVLTALMSGSSGAQWDALRLRTDKTARSELQRPSLLKKLLRLGTTDGTTTSGTTTTTTSGTTTGTTSGTTTGTTSGTTTGTTSGTGTLTGTMSAAGYPELSMVVSNFNVASELVATNLPPSNYPDTVGAFRFICSAGQLLYDDPIMYPGQPGRSHLHQFYGNTSANASSDYNSLRTTGQSTCMSPVNRSAYWMPALLDGKGNVVRPDYVAIYYKRFPKNSPECATGAPKGCISLPNGLRFIFGRDMTNLAAAPTGNFHFICQTQQGGYPPNGSGPNNNGLGYPDMAQALAVCSPGLVLAAIVDAPSCWDGVNLDSSDHRSHVAYAKFTSVGQVCPSGYPYMIPGFTLGARWTIVTGDDTTKWTLSSDAMAPNQPRGSTFHADWFGAWDNTVLAMWNDNCLDKKLSCAGGNLGNGQAMRMFSGFSWTANPRLVPVP